MGAAAAARKKQLTADILQRAAANQGEAGFEPPCHEPWNWRTLGGGTGTGA